MSHQPPQTPRNDRHDQKEVNRRKFVQTIMASVPAASLACAIPAMAGNSGDGDTPADNGESSAQWVCAIQILFQLGDDLAMYLMLNCTTNEFSNFVGTADMELGKCDTPEAGGCHQLSAYNKYPRTDDEFGWVLSPELDDNAIERVKYVSTAMKANVTR
ncbi:MAG: hypothetical protein ACR2NP_05805 [Pirellulaceae bacterium]